MLVSQKCQYAVRAVFELAKRYGEGPVKIAAVAEAQGIPVRFLEVILSQLKQGGFVDSRRGAEGGYFLERSPYTITVGQVVRFVEGDFQPVTCVEGKTPGQCGIHEHCVFAGLYQHAQKALADVYDSSTFQDLVEREKRMSREYVSQYMI